MGHWWNDNDSDKMKYLEIKVSQCLFMPQIPHGTALSGIKPGLHYKSRNKGHDDNSNTYE
jgi:hypothetical protein